MSDTVQRDADRIAFQQHIRSAKGAVREACERHLDLTIAEHNRLDDVIDELAAAGDHLAASVELVCSYGCEACAVRLREALAAYRRERKG